MKIAMTTESAAPHAAGLHQAVRGLARALADAREHSPDFVSVFAPTQGGEILVEWQPARLTTWPAGRHARWWRDRRGFEGLLASSGVDVLHAHGLWHGHVAAAARVARGKKIPLVISPHGMAQPWALAHHAWRKAAARALYARRAWNAASCWHALHTGEVRDIRSLGVRGPVCVISNGVELPQEARLAALAEGAPAWAKSVPAGARVLLFLGRLHPKKNLAALLQAWRGVLQEASTQGQSWYLVIAGWDFQDHLGELQRQVASWPAHAQRRVVFQGPLLGEAKARALAQAAAFVLPSVSEGQPMAVLEAWAHGLPALLTEACGLPEGERAGAALLTACDAPSLQAGLRQLLEMSDEDRGQMGTRGRQLVARHFDWSVIARQWLGIYAWLVHGGPAPAEVTNS